ncbi:MAG: efflux RND transporter permease subunit [Paludibacteraceae bacterium]|nr:efflux RND transporter permease subunit [Paludibacteraceae bacterium]
MSVSGGNIISKAMRQHSIIFAIVAVLVVCGFYGLYEMNKDEFPQFTIRQGVVVGVYPGATSEQVEKQLTTPLERYLFSFQEIDKTKTYSYSEDGIVYLFVELSKDVHDKDEVWSKIRHGLKDFKIQLPAGVLALAVIDDFGNTSSLLITLESADKSPRELEEYAHVLADRLCTIKSLGITHIIGAQHEQIGVYIQPEKLAQYGIDSNTLLARLFTQGFTTTSGISTIDNISSPIHLQKGFVSEEELEEQIVYSDPQGHIVRLQDIATIERCYPKPSSYVVKDGNNTLLLSLEVRPGNNIVAFGKEVDKVLNGFRKTLPPSVSINRITDQPKVVDDSVTGFLTDLLTSIGIVILVMLMLFPLRSALVAGSGIPICTAISLLMMYLFKIDLNTVTLAALIFVLGMIVDNSIVIIDGYIDRLRRGYSRWNSAVVSANELFPPLLLATIAIIGMFFPVTQTLTGPMADFIELFPWTVLFSLGTSLLYAILVVPFLEFYFIRNDAKKRVKPNVLEQGQNAFFNLLQNGYDKLLKWCFKHPYVTLSIGIGAVVGGVLLFLSLNVQMMPKAERSCFAIEIRLPYGSSINETAAVCDSVEAIIKKDERITAVTKFIGSGSPRFHACYAPSLPRVNYAQFIVNTKSNEATESFLKEYTDRMYDYFPNASVRFKQMDYQMAANPIEVHFFGEDLDEIQQCSDRLEAYMRDSLSQDLIWIHTSADESLPCVKVTLKPDEAARVGVTPAVLSLQLAGFEQGQPLTTLWEDDYSIPVVLHVVKDDDKLNLTALENMLVPTATGTWIPLRQVADIEPDYQRASIQHRQGMRAITVSADLKFGKSQPVPMRKIQKFVKDNIEPDMPSSVNYKWGGLTGINLDLIPEIVWGVILAIVVIFAFLLYDFGNIGLATLSLSATLLCLFGAFLGLKMFGLDFGITSVLGVVSLIGIIVRNGIIMFEYAEELRKKEKKSAEEAAFLSGTRRMRPIFLTSATTALGVVPMIISRSTLWMPMGVIICFGTVFSLVLIVTVLPVAYWRIYKSGQWT